MGKTTPIRRSISLVITMKKHTIIIHVKHIAKT
jgi:hypothetical protein